MCVAQLMTRAVSTCRVSEPLARAAQILCETDCGIVPVVNDEGQLLGLITDRDICMAIRGTGRPLSQVGMLIGYVSEAIACWPSDSLETAEQIMRESKSRWLPVIDTDRRVLGVLALSELVRSRGQPGGTPEAINRDLRLRVEPDWKLLEGVREQISAFLRGWRVPSDTIDAVGMVSGELLENALKYAASTAPIVLSVAID